jgi:hypothetical protein
MSAAKVPGYRCVSSVSELPPPPVNKAKYPATYQVCRNLGLISKIFSYLHEKNQRLKVMSNGTAQEKALAAKIEKETSKDWSRGARCCKLFLNVINNNHSKNIREAAHPFHNLITKSKEHAGALYVAPPQGAPEELYPTKHLDVQHNQFYLREFDLDEPSPFATPIERVAVRRNFIMMSFLIEHGALLDSKWLDLITGFSNGHRETLATAPMFDLPPLARAAREAKWKTLKTPAEQKNYLIERLNQAAEFGNLETVLWVLNTCRQHVIHLDAISLATALKLAIQGGYSNLIDEMLKSPICSFSTFSKADQIALIDFCIEMGFPAIASLLQTKAAFPISTEQAEKLKKLQVPAPGTAALMPPPPNNSVRHNSKKGNQTKDLYTAEYRAAAAYVVHALKHELCSIETLIDHLGSRRRRMAVLANLESCALYGAPDMDEHLVTEYDVFLNRSSSMFTVYGEKIRKRYEGELPLRVTYTTAAHEDLLLTMISDTQWAHQKEIGDLAKEKRVLAELRTSLMKVESSAALKPTVKEILTREYGESHSYEVMYDDLPFRNQVLTEIRQKEVWLRQKGAGLASIKLSKNKQRKEEQQGAADALKAGKKEIAHLTQSILKKGYSQASELARDTHKIYWFLAHLAPIKWGTPTLSAIFIDGLFIAKGFSPPAKPVKADGTAVFDPNCEALTHIRWEDFSEEMMDVQFSRSAAAPANATAAATATAAAPATTTATATAKPVNK